MWPFAPKTPPPPRPIPTRLAVRDQAVLATFFGVSVGVDTERHPDITCAASLPPERLARFRSEPVVGEYWSLFRLSGSRTAAIGVGTWALIYLPIAADGQPSRVALPGEWWLDEQTARPRNDGTLFLGPGALPVIDLPAAAEDERRALAAAYGPELLGPVGWQVIALVDG